jgi:protoheme ferro-lyase
VTELVKQNKITHLVVAEHFSVTTDSMSTFHLRKHVEHALHQAGAHIPVVYADQLGGIPAFNTGVIQKIREELNKLPAGAKVAIFLSNHGFPTTTLGKYNATKDCYHQNVHTVFESARDAIMQEIHWNGEFTVAQVFGQFLEKKYHSTQNMQSPQQALEYVSSQGYTHVIDIPYEFPGDSVDVLVKLRQAYGLTNLPDWNDQYETSLNYNDVHMKITSAAFSSVHWINAYYQQTVAAIERVSENSSLQLQKKLAC